MKKLLTIFGAILFASTILTSCGGGENKDEIAKIKPNKVEILGDFADNLQVIDRDYEISPDGKLAIKVKYIDYFMENENDKYEMTISLLNEDGMPVAGSGYFKMDDISQTKLHTLLANAIFEADGNTLKKGQEEILQFVAAFGAYNAKEHAGKVKTFSVSSTIKKDEKTTVSSAAEPESSSTSSNTDCAQFIKDYSDFADSYIAILKKYKANPTDASILSEYTEVAQKAMDMQRDASSCTDPAYASKLMQIANKIAQAAM